jgi:hypothetical protein
MTWSTLIIIGLCLAIVVILTFDALIIGNLKVDKTQLQINNDTLLHNLSMRHPSSPGYRTTDQVIAELEHCLTCCHLVVPQHFTSSPHHVKL